MNVSFSKEMDSLMSMMHSQINQVKGSAIYDGVIPEIQNILGSHCLQDTGTMSLERLVVIRKVVK